MKSINLKLFCSTLLLLFFISSCTFEKRVYRPGYRIEWRKNKSFSDEASNQKQNESEEREINTTPNLQSIPLVDSITVISREQEIIIEQKIPQEQLDQKQNESEVRVNPKENESVEHIKNNLQEMVPLEKVEVIKEVQGISDSGGSNKGLYMILLALLLFGLGLIFFLYLGVFGLIMFIIFSIAAAIYFIVGLFMLIF